MRVKVTLTLLMLFVLVNNMFAQNADVIYEPGLVLGIGIVTYSFNELDDTRKEESNAFWGNKDIRMLLGSQVYAEYYVFSFMSLGAQYQTLQDSVESTRTDRDRKRSVKLENSILYINMLFPPGNGYWRLGGSIGAGRSNYKMTLETHCTSTSSSCEDNTYKGSVEGTIINFGLVADWGADASGGRMGIIASKTNHDKMDDTEVKASGTQSFIDFRFAF